MKTRKNELRATVLSRRNLLSEEQLAYAKAAALEKLLLHSPYQSAQTIMVYMDFRKEVPTALILEHILASGKRLVLPLTDENFSIVPYEIPSSDLSAEKEKFFTTSKMGISEPNPEQCIQIAPEQIDLVIVPGAAFDRQGNRIGYGKGCYDRFLPLLRNDIEKIGLAYDLQLLPQIPAEPQDVKMDEVLVVPVPR